MPKKLSLIPFLIFMISGLIACSGHKFKWKQENGYRWAKLNIGYWGGPGFSEIDPSSTNITFSNNLTDSEIVKNRHLLNGSGVATGDINGDGLTDIYFANLNGPNTLYLNKGDFNFKDVTKSAGVANQNHYSTGVVLADVDGDADLDLLVSSLHKGVSLYLNNGAGKFTLAQNTGLQSTAGKGNTTLALADIDQDSDLDLYVANYKEQSVKDMYSLEELSWDNITRKKGNGYQLIPPFDQHYRIFMGSGKPDRREYGEIDQLFLNDGNGTFNEVTDLSSHFLDAQGHQLGLKKDWGLTAAFADINDDGLPDLYVCNDFWTPDRFWINQGNGIFKAADKNTVRDMSFSSMAVDFSDINRDGNLDFFVTEMMSRRHQERMKHLVNYPPDPSDPDSFDVAPQYMRNTLYLNRGDNTFAEIAPFSNTEATGWSWATRFMDIDMDGYEDLVIATGNGFDLQDLDTQEELNHNYTGNRNMKGYILQYPPLQLPNVILKNDKDLTFSDKSTQWGFDKNDISNGMATADFDNDGDLDLVTNRLNKTAGVFENNTTAPRIAVRLKGKAPNTHAVGAKIMLQGGPVPQQDEIKSGGEYVSGSSSQVVFAATSEDSSYTLSITWPDGIRQHIPNVRINSIYEIDEPADGQPSKNMTRTDPNTNSIFEDISSRIPYTHSDPSFSDFRLQPLLPIKLSNLGPGVSWIDIDRDGDDDLLIASGKGGQLGSFENKGNGQFEAMHLNKISGTAPGDQTTILGWAEGKKTSLIVGSSNYEQGASGSPSAYHYILADKGIKQEKIPGVLSSTGPLAAADYDNDGDIDLFVGGRFKPVQYPKDATSRLFKNEKGGFNEDQSNKPLLEDLGLVTGAVFFDYDKDGDQDLLVSREWDTLKLFENSGGRFHDATKKAGLDKLKGWWNGVAIGDFNNDGQPDIVATNWGENSIYKVSGTRPLKLFYDDFDHDRKIEILDSYYDQDLKGYVPRRHLYDLYQPIPTIMQRLSSHADFAQSTVKKIFHTDPSHIPAKEINTLKTMIFLNHSGTFEAKPLPDVAQFSPAFYAGVLDFNNDGNEDLFLTQNFFELPKIFSRQDAGRGLLLKGDGTGQFKAVPGQQSGIKVYGEQRGAALSDFNKDGKTDIAIGQNNGPAKLYMNRTPNEGISVHLVGPAQNEQAIGSSIRIIYQDGTKGPRREVELGSGYWSQNSTVQIMGTARTPSAIEVTWFDGNVETKKITKGQYSYTITYENM